MQQKFYRLSVAKEGSRFTVSMVEDAEGKFVRREDFDRLMEICKAQTLTDHEYTSAEVASIAGRVLQDSHASEEIKSIAASVLTQARNKERKP